MASSSMMCAARRFSSTIASRPASMKFAHATAVNPVNPIPSNSFSTTTTTSSSSLSPCTNNISHKRRHTALNDNSLVIQKRTWFGFGMPKDADEIAAEGTPGVPIYAREPIDDSADFLEDTDLWSASERAEREDIARELYSMADADPPIPVTPEFYEKVFTLLMKYDDWRGVKTARNVGTEMGISLSVEWEAKLDTYLEDARDRSFHQGGNW